MSVQSNLLVVSDLHIGEELLPGASVERKRGVELASTAFREFLRYHAARRRDGRPWRLVVAGDLFDFMSVAIAPTPELPAKTADERSHGLAHGIATGVLRMRAIGEAHRGLLADVVRFAAAGHRVDVVVGNHDIELLAPAVAAEFAAQLRAAGATDREQARIRVVPWFVHVPGVAWIEHGHVYDEGCSFEFNLAPFDPATGRLIHNADHAAVRYLNTAMPDVDPSAIEEWGFWGFMAFGWTMGWRQFRRVFASYLEFVGALVHARTLHQSFKRRDARRREHRERLARIASDSGLPIDTLRAVDRLARAPLTTGWRRLAQMIMLDRLGILIATVLAVVALLVVLPFGWGFAASAAVIGVAAGFDMLMGKHNVASQLPMRAVPRRLARVIDAPVIVFGHTHDPRWQVVDEGHIYVNGGTWLPATKPGLRKSFTHVLIQPRANGGAPDVELRQWRDGASLPFVATDEVTDPAIPAIAPQGAIAG